MLNATGLVQDLRIVLKLVGVGKGIGRGMSSMTE